MKNKTKSQNLWIDRSILKSPAYYSLSGTAVKVYLEFLYKRRMEPLKVNGKLGKRGKKEWVIGNNGEIVFTYREAKKICNSATFNKKIDELVEKGFIDITRPGIGFARIETLFAISDRWKKYGTDDFIEKKRIKRQSHKFPKGFSNFKK